MTRAASKEEWAAVIAEARNPSERAVLCALAKFANRTNGVVQEPRGALAAAATMSIASFRTHAAALSNRDRGLVAATTLKSPAGDYETTIYTLIGWLHLRGMSEPAHLRLDAVALYEKLAGEPLVDATSGPGEAAGSANIKQGSAKISHGGLPKSSRPGVVEFITPGSDKFQQGSDGFCQTREDSARPRVGDNLQTLEILDTPPLPFPRERGSAGKLRGDAGEVVALVNHLKLDPEKDIGLVVPAGEYVGRWKRLGLGVEEIAYEICVVMAKRDKRAPNADRINTWEFFDKPMIERAAAKRAAADLPALGEGEVNERRSDAGPGFGAGSQFGGPRNAAERETALAGDRRASWGRVAQHVTRRSEP